MRTVLVLMDTLKRDMLSCYNEKTFVKTPNIQNFSKEATIFDQHWIGSAPCMPARRDILCGRLNFLERSWGPIEPFDITLPHLLKQNGCFSHITTDHCHYFRLGGEDYVQQFNTWYYHRGQEGDPWISRIDDPTNMPKNYYGRVRAQYQWNRTQWPNEEDYPSPKTFTSACNWLDDNKGKDNFFLMVEAFDPHEPFDVTEKYMQMYDDKQLDREYFEIPEYQKVNVPKRAVDYIQKRYGALMTMTDHWFGILIKKLKELNMFEDTLVIVTTDHGYFLGERNYFGKNYMHLYNELAHLPFIVKFPGGKRAGERINSITQNIDIMPTVLEYNNIPIPDCVRGKSFKSIADYKDNGKEYALYGYHGMAMNITDGRHTYFRAPNADNWPCYEYTCIPTTIRKYLGKGVEDKIEMGRFFKRTLYPLYRVPTHTPSIIDNVECGLKEVEETKLFNIEKDYAQLENRVGSEVEETYKNLLIRALDENEAPSEQKERFSLL